MGYYFETKDLVVGYHGNPLIKNISIGLEELVGPKVVIEFLNGHAFWRVCHYHNIIMCLG